MAAGVSLPICMGGKCLGQPLSDLQSNNYLAVNRIVSIGIPFNLFLRKDPSPPPVPVAAQTPSRSSGGHTVPPSTASSEANLSGENLSGADLSGADLSGENLSGENLSGAYVNGVNLSGAILTGTIMPDGTIHP